MTTPMYPEYPLPLKKRVDAIEDEEIAKALTHSKGMVTKAADRLDCSPQLLSMRIKESPYLQMIREDCIERRRDNCEVALQDLVDTRDTTAVIFALKTLCKARGYAQDTVVVDATDPVKTLMAQIRNNSKELVNAPKE